MGGDVRPLGGDLVDQEVDRRADVQRCEALGLEPGRERELDEADHAKLLGRLERLGQQGQRALAIAALEQQGGELEPGPGGERAVAHALAERQRVGEVPLGRLVATAEPASKASTRATGP